MGSYLVCSPGRAEAAFQRMQDNGIIGDKLYMLWNDCCDRDTVKAVDLMTLDTIENITRHINHKGGRGIPYSRRELAQITGKVMI